MPFFFFARESHSSEGARGPLLPYLGEHGGAVDRSAACRLCPAIEEGEADLRFSHLQEDEENEISISLQRRRRSRRRQSSIFLQGTGVFRLCWLPR